jgi:pyroglutamyl-peptidase
VKKILMTGFDPFGGEAVNPALEAVKALDGRVLGDTRICVLEVPTVRVKCVERVVQAIEDLDPFAVICVGQAGGRAEITPERVAINVDDFRIKDNEGNQPVDEPIDPEGPSAYFSTLPIKAMVEAMRSKGIPSSVSNTAGTFVCNHLFYGLMRHLDLEGKGRMGGFIHIPYLPEQAVRFPGQPSMSLECTVEGLVTAVQAVLDNRLDLRVSGGREC